MEANLRYVLGVRMEAFLKPPTGEIRQRSGYGVPPTGEIRQ